MDTTRNLIEDVYAEVAKAQAKHPAMMSAHEGRSVIREECDELWSHVMADTGATPAARKEAMQIAAMGARYRADVCGYSDVHEDKQRLAAMVEWTDAMRGRSLSSAHEGHAYLMDGYALLFERVRLGFGSSELAADYALRLSAYAICYARDICR